MTNTDAFMDHFDDGRQAVGGAGGCSHDFVLCGVIKVFVDADDDVEHIADLDGGGDNHALGATIKVALNGLGRQKLARALQDDFDA
jgi:hypothetical protein